MAWNSRFKKELKTIKTAIDVADEAHKIADRDVRDASKKYGTISEDFASKMSQKQTEIDKTLAKTLRSVADSIEKVDSFQN